MEDKYYTPEIEEFHVGFEFERLVSMKGGTAVPKEEHHETWEKRIGTKQEIAWMLTNFPNVVRVKYLNQEDIESCGWKHVNDNYYTFNDTHELYMLDNHRILIKEILTESNMNKRLDNPHTVYYHLFDVTIKNKSVLKQVLKMIGVIG